MSDEFSNFKSAIVWPKDAGDDAPTGDFKPFNIALSETISAAAESFSMAGVTESPIETFFGARFALYMRKFCEERGWTFAVSGEANISLQPQFVLGRFRYDFGIIIDGKPVVLIECDGKDFHSSAEQQANDVLKDAKAKEAGMVLLRFTGSDLNRDADGCVAVALRAMAKGMR